MTLQPAADGTKRSAGQGSVRAQCRAGRCSLQRTRNRAGRCLHQRLARRLAEARQRFRKVFQLVDIDVAELRAQRVFELFDRQPGFS